MSKLSKSNAAKPVWQPMAVLKNVEFENVRFLQNDYSRPRTSEFKEWEHKEAPLNKALPQSQTEEDSAAPKDAAQKTNAAPTTIDKALLEKETSAAYAKGLQEGEDKAKAYAETQAEAIKLNKEYKQLEPIVEAFDEYENILSNILSAKEILAEEKDEEMPPPVLLPCYWNKGLNKA